MNNDQFRMFAPSGSLFIEESTALCGTADEVWPEIGRFCSQDWHPGILRSEIFEGLDGQIGAMRDLKTRDGMHCIEELLWQNDDLHTQVYRAIDTPLPVRDYVAEMEVSDEDGHCRFTWRSRFDPDDTTTDSEALNAVAQIFQAGIHALHQRFDAPPS